MNTAGFTQLADLIKYHRKRKYITQRELAELIGVHYSSISKWESGLIFPRIDSIIRMAKIFEIRISDMFDCQCYNRNPK